MDIKEQYTITDLTHTLHTEIPVWPGIKTLEHETYFESDEHGCTCKSLNVGEGVGTHMDAPRHFNKNGKTISELTLDELIAPACVIDIRPQVQSNPDYGLTVTDVLAWEKQYKTINKDDVVLILTGWSQYWRTPEKYLNKDQDGVMHFPATTAGAAELMVERQIAGIGVDVLSVDMPTAEGFPAHKILLGNNKYQIESLKNLEQLPPTGATVFALPLKIQNGCEAPSWVIALY